ncbi:MAG: hypothetical protein LAT82_00570 [Nanoarchaeota archaeon]|nr:hypothetical protein [Nanoarchaeota archaeon]
MLLYLLVLIDIHTLFILLFHNSLNIAYIFTGFSLAFIKGLIFFLMGRDLFSLIDMIIAVLMLLLLLSMMPIVIKIIIALYLLYKIFFSIIPMLTK